MYKCQVYYVRLTMDFYYCDHATTYVVTHWCAYNQVNYHHYTPMQNDIITHTEQRTKQNSHAMFLCQSLLFKMSIILFTILTTMYVVWVVSLQACSSNTYAYNG